MTRAACENAGCCLVTTIKQHYRRQWQDCVLFVGTLGALWPHITGETEQFRPP
jgi:hypothetical protein